MRKIISILASMCCCLIFGLLMVGCGTVAVEEIKFESDSVTLASGASVEVPYTVTPADGSVVFEVAPASEKVFDYTVSEGKVTIQAASTGTGTLYIISKSDKTIYANCKVTVNAPSGYKAYRETDVKFVYPSSWSRTTMSGMLMCSNDTGSSNLGLVSESKNSTYFSASASDFEKTLRDTYQALGYGISGLQCTVEKYDGNKAIRVDAQYTLSVGGYKSSIGQVALIRNSANKTHVLTLTNMTASQIETIQNEFYAW